MLRFNHFIRIASAALLLLTANARAAQSIDWIVATVNDEAVLRSELLSEVEVLRVLFADTSRSLLSTEELTQLAVTNLVNLRLQIQRADFLNIAIPQTRVDGVIEQLLIDTQINTAEQLARREGMTVEQFRQRLLNELRINEALFIDNREELGVSVEQVNELLRARLSDQRLREYLIQYAHLQSEDNDIAQSLRDATNDDFESIASEHHIGNDPITIGWRRESQLSELVISEIRKLEPGETSEVIELGESLHVFRVIAVRPLVPGSIRRELVKLQLLSIDNTSDVQALENAKSAIMEGESDFPGAAEVITGQVSMVEYQMDELPEQISQGMRLRVGEIGGPFLLPTGLAIAQVIEVQQETFGDDQLRSDAINTMGNINVEEVRRKWIEYLLSVGTVNIVRAEL